MLRAGYFIGIEFQDRTAVCFLQYPFWTAFHPPQFESLAIRRLGLDQDLELVRVRGGNAGSEC